jgi:hypothetical protein
MSVDWVSHTGAPALLETSLPTLSYKAAFYQVIEKDPSWKWSPPPATESACSLWATLSSAELDQLRLVGVTWGRHFIETTVLSRMENEHISLASVIYSLLPKKTLLSTYSELRYLQNFFLPTKSLQPSQGSVGLSTRIPQAIGLFSDFGRL